MCPKVATESESEGASAGLSRLGAADRGRRRWPAGGGGAAGANGQPGGVGAQRAPRFPRAWRHPAEARGTCAQLGEGRQPATPRHPGPLSRGMALSDGSRKPCLPSAARLSRQQGRRDHQAGLSFCAEPRDGKRFPLFSNSPAETRPRGRAARWPRSARTKRVHGLGLGPPGRVNHPEGCLAQVPVSERLWAGLDVDFLAVLFQVRAPPRRSPSGVRGLFEREEAFLKWRVMDRLNPSGAFRAGVSRQLINKDPPGEGGLENSSHHAARRPPSQS